MPNNHKLPGPMATPEVKHWFKVFRVLVYSNHHPSQLIEVFGDDADKEPLARFLSGTAVPQIMKSLGLQRVSTSEVPNVRQLRFFNIGRAEEKGHCRC